MAPKVKKVVVPPVDVCVGETKARPIPEPNVRRKKVTAVAPIAPAMAAPQLNRRSSDIIVVASSLKTVVVVMLIPALRPVLG